MRNEREPRWLAAALEAEADILQALDRALAIDQAAQRRAVLPDVVRRQVRCLEYVRAYGDPHDIRAGMSAIELLVTLERVDAHRAGAIRRRVFAGEVKVDALRAEAARARGAEGRHLDRPDRTKVLARLRNDLPDFARLRILDAGDDTLGDPVVVGADFAGVVADRSSARTWAWAGVLAPSMSGCLRGERLRDLVRSVMAASLWADTVSVVVMLAREAEAVGDALAHARSEDRSRVSIHDWRTTGVVLPATSVTSGRRPDRDPGDA